MIGPDDFDYDDDIDDGELGDEEECQMNPEDGTCALAGTEFCDWDCPYNIMDPEGL